MRDSLRRRRVVWISICYFSFYKDFENDSFLPLRCSITNVIQGVGSDRFFALIMGISFPKTHPFSH